MRSASIKREMELSRVDFLRRKNQSIDEKLMQTKQIRVDQEEDVIKKHDDKAKSQTVRLRNIYNHSLRMFEE